VLDNVSEDAANALSTTSAEEENWEGLSRHKADETATLDLIERQPVPPCTAFAASRRKQADDKADILTSEATHQTQVSEATPKSSKTFQFRSRARQPSNPTDSMSTGKTGMSKSKSVEVSLSCDVDYAVEVVQKQVYQFAIHYSANFGESIVLVGSHQALGNWVPAQGLTLSWSSGDLWSGSIELESNLEFEYKYACVSHNTLRWEAGPNRSRSAAPATTSPVLLKDLWRN
jgi:hypothetical protein